MLQEGGPLPGPQTGLLFNIQKWIVWGNTCADKARDLIGKGHPVESSRLRGTALPRGSQSQFYGDGISFQVVFSQLFWLRVLPGGACLVQPRWMPERRILGGGLTCGVSFRPFANSSSWWWLISPVFLTRTSCHKTTHANGYYGAWPGWAVSVSVLPLKGSLLLLTQIKLMNAPNVKISMCLQLPRSPASGNLYYSVQHIQNKL